MCSVQRLHNEYLLQRLHGRRPPQRIVGSLYRDSAASGRFTAQRTAFAATLGRAAYVAHSGHWLQHLRAGSQPPSHTTGILCRTQRVASVAHSGQPLSHTAGSLYSNFTAGGFYSVQRTVFAAHREQPLKHTVHSLCSAQCIAFTACSVQSLQRVVNSFYSDSNSRGSICSASTSA